MWGSLQMQVRPQAHMGRSTPWELQQSSGLAMRDASIASSGMAAVGRVIGREPVVIEIGMHSWGPIGKATRGTQGLNILFLVLYSGVKLGVWA